MSAKTPTDSTSTLERMQGLDVLRGIAILLVLGRHGDYIHGGGVGAVITNHWIWAGWTGVDLFFTISGFLVSGLLFGELAKHGDIHAGRFLIRRGFKIYPSFYAFVAVSAIVTVGSGQAITWQQILSEVLFIRNYWIPWIPHTWSLDVEEHFYFALVLLLVAAHFFRRVGLIPVICLVIGIVCPLLRFDIARAAPFNYETHFFPTHLRIDELGWGVALSWAYHVHRARLEHFCGRHSRWLLGIGIAAYLPSAVIQMEHTRFMHVWYPSVLALGGCCLVAFCLFTPWRAPRGMKPVLTWIARVGVYSYTIYLWHMLAASWSDAVLASWGFRTDSIGANISYMLLAIVLGIAVSLLIESPALRFRNRNFPSRSASPIITESGDGGPASRGRGVPATDSEVRA